MPTTKPRTRGQGAKTPERRAATARAALDIVQERGHRAVTTAEVAERANMSERAMLYHFPTRDHILVAALDLADSDDADRLRADYQTMSGTPELEVIARTFAGAAIGNDQTIRLRSAMASAAIDPEHPAHAFFERHFDKGAQGLAAIVRVLQAKGAAHPDLDRDEAGRLLLAAWQGLEGMWLVTPSFDLADALITSFRRLVGQPLMQQRALLDQLAATV